MSTAETFQAIIDAQIEAGEPPVLNITRPYTRSLGNALSETVTFRGATGAKLIGTGYDVSRVEPKFGGGTTYPMFDFIGCSHAVISGVHITGGPATPNTAVDYTDEPACAILFGRASNDAEAGHNTIINSHFTGRFIMSCIVDVGGTGNKVHFSHFVNHEGPTLTFNGADLGGHSILLLNENVSSVLGVSTGSGDVRGFLVSNSLLSKTPVISRDQNGSCVEIVASNTYNISNVHLNGINAGNGTYDAYIHVNMPGSSGGVNNVTVAGSRFETLNVTNFMDVTSSAREISHVSMKSNIMNALERIANFGEKADMIELRNLFAIKRGVNGITDPVIATSLTNYTTNALNLLNWS